ncbi:MAG: hypothetical protein MUE55_04770 [Thermoplasmata archaeon]|jgi:hypothetical protein|nr:hypothetical protein [Thermoplasmata archaeon]
MTRTLRFRCAGCGLQFVLEERPGKCFCCGSTKIVREGWRQRFDKAPTDENRNDRRSKEARR